MAREPVTQNGNSVDRTTAIEMDLQLIGSSSIVYLGFSTVIISGVKKHTKNMLIMKKKTKKSYISYIDWSVVCIYPLLRSHVVERSCEQNKHDCKQCFCTRSIKNAPYTQGVTPFEINTMITRIKIALSASFDSTYLRIWLPSDCISGLKRNQEEGREGWKAWGDAQRQKNCHRQQEDPSGSLGLTASSHWAVMRHMGHRCKPDGGGSGYLSPACRLRCYTPG